MGSFVSLMLLASFSVCAVPRVDTGALIEQAVIGLMGAAAAGFLTGELAWIAAPEISDTTEEYPLRTKQRAAVAAAYSVGVPFGSALGVHVSGLAMGRKTPFWPKWVGAELGALAAGGISLLILSQTKADTAEYNPHLVDRPVEVLAAALPVAAGVSGAFLGSWLAHKLGWAEGGVPPVRIGLYPAGDGFAVSCKLCLSF
ncbi:hypothetical protein CEE36_05805 [candidate division TA06 bacterium B3_TA06]|uniref:Sulphur transport domain-containing protein n=1 Tax=candidate division TA06 bacterium B3_TA06 TaxID=2012487 RepID=A0A532V733_UNCT6|nr:MAG: hypothetical protein CEE36_05805 [candidate division TA06 bacterium B3_TA06]